MNYHKIRNVPMNVCTTEQLIAYKLASTYASCIISDRYKSAQTGVQRSEVVYFTVKHCMNVWENIRTEKQKKYDIDAIFCALNAGMGNYLKETKIFTDYKQVGEAFPAYYLNK